MSALDDKSKKKHLLRRLGWGASQAERQRFDGISVAAMIEVLLNPGTKDIGHPAQFWFRKDEAADTGAHRLKRFWALQMVASHDVLREKMALFWHDHFAVSDAMVDSGLMMHDYLERLRSDPLGRFEDILVRVAESPAFLRMLNVEMIFRDTPNENFGREVLELYTLGVGNYTESDIKEVSRAFTGWTYDAPIYHMTGSEDDRLRRIIRTGTPAVSFAYLSAVHDPGEKTILGIKKKWTGHDVLRYLANHPKTADHLCRKLWGFFGSEAVSESAVKAMVATFLQTKGSIRAVMKTMVDHQDFYSPEVVGRLIKSPVEYVIGVTRALNGAALFKGKLSVDAAPDEPHSTELLDAMGAVAYFCEIAGQDLLYPPDVAGWNWHKAWINTQTVLQRKRYRGMMLWEPYKDAQGKDAWRPSASLIWLRGEMKLRKLETPDQVITAFDEILDIQLRETSKVALAEAWAKGNGMDSIQNDNWFSGRLTELLDFALFAPEYQVH